MTETTYYPETECEETEQSEQVRAEKPKRKHIRTDYDSLMRVAKAAGINQMWARVSVDYLKYAFGNPVEEAKIIASLRNNRPEMFKPDPPAPKPLPIRRR